MEGNKMSIIDNIDITRFETDEAGSISARPFWEDDDLWPFSSSSRPPLNLGDRAVPRIGILTRDEHWLCELCQGCSITVIR